MAQLQYWNGTEFVILNSAAELEYDNSQSTLESETIQTAIDELDNTDQMIFQEFPGLVSQIILRESPELVTQLIMQNSTFIKVSNLLELEDTLSDTSKPIKRIICDTQFDISTEQIFRVYGINIFYSDLIFNVSNGAILDFRKISGDVPTTYTLIKFGDITNKLLFLGAGHVHADIEFYTNNVDFYITKIETQLVDFLPGSDYGSFEYAINDSDTLPPMAKQYDNYIQNLSLKNAVLGDAWNWEDFNNGTNTITINDPRIRTDSVIFIESIVTPEYGNQLGYWTAETFDGYFTITSTENETEAAFTWAMLTFPLKPM